MREELVMTISRMRDYFERHKSHTEWIVCPFGWKVYRNNAGNRIRQVAGFVSGVWCCIATLIWNR